MKEKLAQALRWIANKLDPQEIRKVLTPFGEMQVVIPKNMLPGKSKEPKQEEQPKRAVLYGYEEEPATGQIAGLYLGSKSEEDIQLALGWLTKITGSAKHAEANILLLSLLDRTRFEAQLPGDTEWNVWIEGEGSQFNAARTDVHIHGQLKFKGEHLLSLCRDMEREEFNNGKGQLLLASYFEQYYSEKDNPEKLPLVNWEKIATVNSLLRQ